LFVKLELELGGILPKRKILKIYPDGAGILRDPLTLSKGSLFQALCHPPGGKRAMVRENAES